MGGFLGLGTPAWGKLVFSKLDDVLVTLIGQADKFRRLEKRMGDLDTAIASVGKSVTELKDSQSKQFARVNEDIASLKAKLEANDTTGAIQKLASIESQIAAMKAASDAFDPIPPESPTTSAA